MRATFPVFSNAWYSPKSHFIQIHSYSYLCHLLALATKLTKKCKSLCWNYGQCDTDDLLLKLSFFSAFNLFLIMMYLLMHSISVLSRAGLLPFVCSSIWWAISFTISRYFSSIRLPTALAICSISHLRPFLFSFLGVKHSFSKYCFEIISFYLWRGFIFDNE